MSRDTEEAPVVGAKRLPGSETTPPGAGGSLDGIRWMKGLLLAVIAICALAGIVSTAAMGQTQAALAIGIIALAFFSRVGC
ncbi:MAG TPA: hypothetical protein VI217_08300 [Mycobacterium sp.]